MADLARVVFLAGGRGRHDAGQADEPVIGRVPVAAGLDPDNLPDTWDALYAAAPGLTDGKRYPCQLAWQADYGGAGFYLPWLNHDLNASYNLSDAAGPIQRGIILNTCNGANLAYGAAALLPQVKTIVQSIPLPRPNQLPAIKGTEGLQGCGPE